MHRHGIVLVKPFVRSFLIAAAGVGCLLVPWRYAGIVGVSFLTLAAFLVVVAVARWDRTHLELTGSALVVEHGFLRRRSASVSLNATVFEIERSLVGRLFGYATVVVGELEIDFVPRRLTRLLQQRR